MGFLGDGVAHTSNLNLLSVLSDSGSLLGTLEAEESSSEEDRSLGALSVSVHECELSAVSSWLVEDLVETE